MASACQLVSRLPGGSEALARRQSTSLVHCGSKDSSCPEPPARCSSSWPLQRPFGLHPFGHGRIAGTDSHCLWPGGEKRAVHRYGVHAAWQRRSHCARERGQSASTGPARNVGSLVQAELLRVADSCFLAVRSTLQPACVIWRARASCIAT